MKEFFEKLRSRVPWEVWLALVLAAFVAGYLLRGGEPEVELERQARAALEEGVQPGKTETALYACPMMCVPATEQPGNCPVCGMEMVPIAEGAVGREAGPPRLKLSPAAARLAEIQVAPVERKFVSAEVRLYGKIDYDPAHMSYVTAFMPGVVDRVYVKRAGQFVRWGDRLFDFYSSDLLAAQQQLFEAMKHVPSFYSFQTGTPHVAREAQVQPLQSGKEKGQKTPEVEEALKTIDAIRYKLAILGMPKRDIDELMMIGEPTGIATVYSPMYGQVIEQNAYEGTYVNTGTPIFSIGDPEYVWVKLDAYESDYPWIRKRQKVTFQTDAYPGETFTGEVVYIDPVFKAKTRTFDVGVLFSDKGGRLKAGMLVRAVIHAELAEDGRVVTEKTGKDRAPLVIPASAPLITGKRAVVYVSAPGEEVVFEPREVVLGPRATDHYLVKSGLKEGEQVVVNGNFKIDSAIQIIAKPAAPAHQHTGPEAMHPGHQSAPMESHSGQAANMMDIEGGHSATEHHQHGGSEVMHEDYWSERTDSRLGNEAGSAEADRAAEHRMKWRDRSRSSGRARDSSVIQRRRPGAYGDTLRRMPPSQDR